MQRNRVFVAAALGVVLALVVGLVTTAREARRANRRFDDVRRLANSILFELEPEISMLSGSTKARNTLVRRSLEHLEHLAREAGGNRELRRELATAYEKVGNVRGNPTVTSLGDIKGALASIDKAKAIRLELVANAPHDARARHELAVSPEDLGDIAWWSDNTDGALKNYRAALALRRILITEQPGSTEFRKGLGSLLMSLADVYSWNNQLTETQASLHEALPVLQALACRAGTRPRRLVGSGRFGGRNRQALTADDCSTLLSVVLLAASRPGWHFPAWVPTRTMCPDSPGLIHVRRRWPTVVGVGTGTGAQDQGQRANRQERLAEETDVHAVNSTCSSRLFVPDCTPWRFLQIFLVPLPSGL